MVCDLRGSADVHVQASQCLATKCAVVLTPVCMQASTALQQAASPMQVDANLLENGVGDVVVRVASDDICDAQTTRVWGWRAEQNPCTQLRASRLQRSAAAME